MGHPVWVPCVMCMVLHGPYGLMGTRVLHGHPIWEPCEMCMVLHGQCEHTETWVLNGPSCMGTMCDVHGLTWAIRAYGNEGFTWASNMGTMRDVHGLAWAMRTHRNVGFEWAILYGDHV